MFKNRFLKKLSIGIVSLALVCPLALGTTKSFNAKASHTNTSQITQYRKSSRLTPVAKVKNNISNDNKILSTEQAHYYLDVQKDLSKNERAMKSLKLTRHTNVHYKRNGQSQTVYIPEKQMTAGYKNSLHQSKYLSNDFYGDISRDKKILRHHKSGRTASLAIKNLA